MSEAATALSSLRQPSSSRGSFGTSVALFVMTFAFANDGCLLTHLPSVCFAPRPEYVIPRS